MVKSEGNMKVGLFEGRGETKSKRSDTPWPHEAGLAVDHRWASSYAPAVKRAWASGLIGAALLGAPVWAVAGERVDLFDGKGQRTGYAIVDHKSGRVDFYDTFSKRTGWGRADDYGRVERFGLDGRRQSDTALPLPQERRRR